MSSVRESLKHMFSSDVPMEDKEFAFDELAPAFIQELETIQTLGLYKNIQAKNLKGVIKDAFTEAYSDEILGRELKKYLSHHYLETKGIFHTLAFWYFFLREQHADISTYRFATHNRVIRTSEYDDVAGEAAW